MDTKTSTRNAGKSASRRTQGKPQHKKRGSRRRRLTDKIRAALARAAALGRRDVTQQLGGLYQARVEEELGRGRQRRSRDAGVEAPRARRNR